MVIINKEKNNYEKTNKKILFVFFLHL